MQEEYAPKNMRVFMIIWIGQLISMVGSGLTGFGLSVWIFEQTGQATPIALTALFFNLPRVLLSPIAGSIADRKNRRMIMILADIGAALSTAIVALLLFTGNLEIWHIYLTTSISSAFGAFQEPAYRASMTMLVPKKDLVRAGGIQQIGFAIESILTPVIAGALYMVFDLRGIILIDFATFFFAIGALAIIRIPQPRLTTVTQLPGEKTSMLRDAAYGWNYLRERPGLFGLLWYYAVVNFFLSLSGVLVAPLVLSFSTPTGMGVVQMAGGLAMLAGGLLISAWGGPKNRLVPWVILTIALNGFGYFLYGLRPSIPLIAVANFFVMFFIPISASLSQAVWQKKVAPDIQGRIFAIRAMIAYSIIPLANLSAGPLVDRFFGPLMAKNGLFSSTFIASIIGTGEGRGVGLIFIVSAFFLWVASLIVFANPRIRNLEDEIPDAIQDEETSNVAKQAEVYSEPVEIPAPTPAE